MTDQHGEELPPYPDNLNPPEDDFEPPLLDEGPPPPREPVEPAPPPPPPLGGDMAADLDPPPPPAPPPAEDFEPPPPAPPPEPPPAEEFEPPPPAPPPPVTDSKPPPAFGNEVGKPVDDAVSPSSPPSTEDTTKGKEVVPDSELLHINGGVTTANGPTDTLSRSATASPSPSNPLTAGDDECSPLSTPRPDGCGFDERDIPMGEMSGSRSQALSQSRLAFGTEYAVSEVDDAESQAIVASLHEPRKDEFSPEKPTAVGGPGEAPPPAEGEVAEKGEKPPKKRSLVARFRSFSDKFLDSLGVTIFMLIVTFYVLFIDDVLAVLVLPADEELDRGILVSKFVVFVMFVIELVWSSWAKYKTYFLSFFFWLDVIALVSFAPDIMLFFGYDLLSNISGLAVARAGRAARASARAARLVRVVRVVKVARAMGRAGDTGDGGDVIDKLDRNEISEGSTGIGRKLIQVTTNKVVAIVLALFMVVSLAQAPAEWMVHTQAGLEAIEASIDFAGLNSTLVQDSVVPQFAWPYQKTLILLEHEDQALVGSREELATWRSIYLFSDITASQRTEAHFSVASTERLQAILNMAVLFFVILVLCVGNALITRDANRLIVAPVEKMVQVLRFLTKEQSPVQHDDSDEGDDADNLMNMLSDIVESSVTAQQSSSEAALARKAMQDRLADLIAQDKRREMELRLYKREADAAVRKKTPVSDLLTELDPFEDPDVENDTITYEDNHGVRQVRGATMARLLWKLTHPAKDDDDFFHSFMVTFREFSNCHELLEFLVIRYCITKPEMTGETEEEVREKETAWRNEVQLPIRTKVVKVLLLWVNFYFGDFKRDTALLTLLVETVRGLLPDTGMSEASSQLSHMIEKRARGEAVNSLRAPIGKQSIPIFKAGKVSIDAVDCREAARQMALVEFPLYRAIEVHELFGCCWSKKNKEVDSPNVLKVIDHFNHMTQWVQAQVLHGSTPKIRAQALSKFVRMCDESLRISNYNGAFEILSGLSSASLSRLKKTWAEVSPEDMEGFKALSEKLAASGAYKNYRNHVRELESTGEEFASVPYIGMYLGDLIFIDEGNPDTTEEGLINFGKWIQYANAVQEALKWQNLPFPFHAVPDIQQWMKAATDMDEKKLYQLSLTQEPRAKATRKSTMG